jgi:hypothetical protein
MSQSQTPTRAPALCNPIARFAATVDFPTPPLPLAMAMMCLTPGILVADSRTAHARRWRVNVDQDFRFGTPSFRRTSSASALNGARNRGVIRSQHHLHARFGIRRNDFLDQTKRNDVPAEAGIFHRAQVLL